MDNPDREPTSLATADLTQQADITQQAEKCTAVTRARQLADWVGTGKPVTAAGVLRRPDVPLAAAAIGVVAPAKLRSAADLPVLHHPWAVAQAAGWLVIANGRATSASEALADADSGRNSAGEGLRVWLAGFDAVLRVESHDRLQRGGGVAGWLVLTALAGEVALTSDQLDAAVHHLLDTPAFIEAGFEYADASAAGKAFGRGLTFVEATIAVLTDFGAVVASGDELRLTPLGRWAATRLRDRAAEADPSELTASALLTRLAEVPDPEGWTADGEGWTLASRWLSNRSTPEAATDLLRAAASAAPAERVIGTEIAAAMGDPALPAWQAALDVPVLTAHARAILSANDIGPELSAAEARWLAVEYTLITLARDGAQDAEYAVRQFGGWDALRGSGHPDELVLSDAVAGVVASGQRPRVFQVRIGLGRRKQTSVWRTVLVESSATLADLHDVIRVVMGWGSDHLHVFTVGNTRYSDPDFGLEGCGDEYEVRLSRALPKVGAVVNYVYDLGDFWEHTITLKKVVEAEPDVTYPTCVEGQGDAPVEDWTPADPDDPDDPEEPEFVPFDQDEINRTFAGRARPVAPTPH